jgi:hypothetical protein
VILPSSDGTIMRRRFVRPRPGVALPASHESMMSGGEMYLVLFLIPMCNRAASRRRGVRVLVTGQSGSIDQIAAREGQTRRSVSGENENRLQKRLLGAFARVAQPGLALVGCSRSCLRLWPAFESGSPRPKLTPQSGSRETPLGFVSPELGCAWRAG